MSRLVRLVLALVAFLPVHGMAFSPRIDIKGIVKSFDATTVTLETHGRQVLIPRRAFENDAVLAIGADAKARVEIRDLGKIKSARK